MRGFSSGDGKVLEVVCVDDTQQCCSSCRRATHLKMAGMADCPVGVYDYHWVS